MFVFDVMTNGVIHVRKHVGDYRYAI